MTGSTSGATGMKGSSGALQGCRGQRQLARLIRRRGTRRVRAFNLSAGEIDPERDRHSPTRLTLRYWCSGMGLNHRRPALQAGALPLSYPSECLSVGPGSYPDLAGSGLRRPPTTGPPRAVRDSRKDIHIDGRSSGVRTHDLPPPRRTRYQAAPYSDFRSLIRITGTLGDGAGNRVRTGDIQLGRLALYQLSYTRELLAKNGDIRRTKVFVRVRRSQRSTGASHPEGAGSHPPGGSSASLSYLSG